MARNRSKYYTVECPKCKAPKGKPCKNLSSRAGTWQTWVPDPHKERRQKCSASKQKAGR